MGSLKKYPPVKLIFGLIFKEDKIYEKVRLILKKYFGRIDFESITLPFIYTDYYEKELGKDLKRRFISMHKLINPARLYNIKILTNRLEKKFSIGNSRLINIDPGYLDLTKLILASTKDFSHRLYLNKGVFAELTLFFKNKTFQILDWTYPDYRTSEYISIFKQIREIYAQQIKKYNLF